jgi:alkylation response protein AidB-like acyl-CoA dehydrogenase
MLARIATRTEEARLLTVEAARKKASGDRADVAGGIAKYLATEAAGDNPPDCRWIRGGYGHSTEYRLERCYRDALLLIGEGSNESQQLIIARSLREGTA